MISTIRRRMIIAALAVLLAVPLFAAGTPEPAAAGQRRAKLILARDHPDRTERSRAGTLAARPSDVTGDGLADAVVRDPGADRGTLRLYAHSGATAGNPWPAAETLGGAWGFADPLLLGDVTGDDHPDLVTRDAAGALSIFPYRTDAQPNPWPDRVAAGTGWSRYNTLLLGDVTGDGRPDLLGRDPGAASGTLWIIRHDGSAQNPYGSTPVWAGTGWNLADAMLLGDVNGDDFPDIVVRDGAGALWIYPHNGATSQNPYTSRAAAGTGWPVGQPLLLADATGDDRPDLIAQTGDRLVIHPHGGATTGNVWGGTAIEAGSGWDFANTMITGDVTGDGRPDLLARVHRGDLWVYPNDGETPWVQRFSAGNRWTYEDQLLLGDVTGDGNPDLVARDPRAANGTLWLYPGTGATDADPWTAPRTFAGTGWNLATALALGDLTGDGRPDVLLRDRGGELWVYPHSGLAGPGNPWTVQRRWVGSGWTTARELRLADVDGDGRADLIDLERDGTLWVYPTGGTTPIKIAGDFTDVGTLAVGAVDDTGRPSLVTITRTGDVINYAHSGGPDPWPAGRVVASAWTFASALLL